MPDLSPKQDPKFALGELVEIRDKKSALYGKRYRVQKAVRKTWQDPVNRRKWTQERWKYQLPVISGDGFSFFWEEYELVKLDANEECEWRDCLWQPDPNFKLPHPEDDDDPDTDA